MKKFNIGLTTSILLSLISGVLFGHFLPNIAISIKFIGEMFIRLITLIVVPLIFSSLIVGVAGAGTFTKMGRLGIKSILWFEFASAVSLLFGLLFGNLLQPGYGIAPIVSGNSTAAGELAKNSLHLHDYFVNIIPSNIVQALSGGNILQLVVFACIFGVSMAIVGEKARPALAIAEGVSEIMFQFTRYVLKLAPYGVFAFTASTVGQYGIALLLPLIKLIGALYLAVIIFILLFLATATTIAGVNFLQLLRALKDPLLLGFGTSSSEAALPLAMQRLEQFGVSNRTASFVLPLGFSFNLNGSTLFCTLASLFLAQVYHIDLTWTQQLTMFLMFMLSSKGIAGIPGSSLIVIAGTAIYFGLPIEGIALIMGVDRIMDMARTSCNLLGNCVATVVIARWEKELSQFTLQAAYQKNYTDPPTNPTHTT